MERLGEVPRVGQTVDIDGWRMEIIDLDGLRIDKLIVKRDAAARWPDATVPRGRRSNGLRRRDCKNVAIGTAQDGFRHAPEKEAGEAAATVRSDDHEIGRVVPRR
ncbi:hypothetical protein Ga0609869_002008 [Rhodovulum iodosum]|uniref:Transporter-associated domain-containing protein n=1 Tax=Rhodovulum iodosum TaxID=68291 RepID=A0ABV3XTI7_9RHOB|nr:hypothetical protein EJA01_12820 [Rhodovulum robiginosum]